MKVKVTKSMTGRVNGVRVPPIGETVDVPDDVGAALVADGIAEKVGGSKPAEKATAAPAGEKRSRRKKADAD